MHRAFALVIPLLFATLSRADFPNYAISLPLGLKDAKHTAANGRQSSRAWFTAGKFATGTSDGYKANQAFGNSVWWTDGAQVVRLGYTGFNYTGHLSYIDGIQQSYPKGINSSGTTIGYSVVNPSDYYSSFGTPWIWDGTTLTELGLDGPGYRDNFNRKSAGVSTRGINDAGDVIGSSGRYSGGQSIGVRPWLRRNGAYLPLGLTGGDYTMNGGYEYSEVYKLNQAGQVLGASQRAGALSYIGWISDGASYKYVGLITPDNENITPFHHSLPIMMNEAGQAAGIATIEESSTRTQVHAVWFYDGLESRRVGLTGDQFTGDLTGFQRSELTTLTESGYLLGTSSLVQQTYDFGTGAWVSDGATTRRIGLWDAQHTRNDGWQYSYSPWVNSNGQTAGFSSRFTGSADLGGTAWIDDGVATQAVGHYDAAYTRADGYQLSSVELLADSGDAVGFSARYTGATEVGRTGWYYDAQTGTLTDLFSTVAPPGGGFGAAYVAFNHLGEDGAVLGSYQTYPGGGSQATSGMFTWTPDDGLITFENHVLAGLDAWDSFMFVDLKNGDDFLGQGWTGPNANSPMAFRLNRLAAADRNYDQTVDAQDLALIVNDFGSGSTAGDANGDGMTDGADMLLWQQQFDAAPLSDAVAVPEPAAPVVAFAAILCTYVSIGNPPRQKNLLTRRVAHQ